MKVRITFDITDDQRLAISAVENEEFRPATREEIVDYIEGIVEYRLGALGSNYRQAMDEIVSKLKVS